MPTSRYDEERINEEEDEYARKAEALAVYVSVEIMSASADVARTGKPMTSWERSKWLSKIQGVVDAYNATVSQQARVTVQEAIELGETWAESSVSGYEGWASVDAIRSLSDTNASELARAVKVDLPSLYLKRTNGTFQNVSQYAETLFTQAHSETLQGESPETVIRNIAKEMYKSEGIGIARNGRLYNLEGYIRLQVGGRWARTVNDYNTEIGALAGFDAIQITAHALCAPDHLPYQGGIYTNEEFEEVQASLDRPIAQGYNCRHILHPCHADDKNMYTDEELEEARRRSTELVEVDGKQMTRYEASQWQRKQERTIRKYKTRAKIADAGKLTDEAAKWRAKAREYTARYKEISADIGLKVRMERTRVGVLEVSSSDRRPIMFSTSTQSNQYFENETNALRDNGRVASVFNAYTHDNGVYNVFWRKGSVAILDEMKDIVIEETSIMDNWIAQQKLSDDIVVYREMRRDIFELVTSEGVYHDDGYTSTSTLFSAVKDDFSVDKGIWLEIIVPAGTGRGAYINGVSDYEDAEYEYVIGRGADIRITQSWIDLDGRRIVRGVLL